MQIRSVGIDLGKTTFHLVALGAAGKVLVKRKFTRKQLLAFTANMQTSLIGLEACSGAHFLGRAACGTMFCLIAAQFVKPFVKSNKNDFVDAEAIAEAVERKNMRFVPIKTDDQLDLQAIHRVRDRLVSRRTAVINQLRAFLLERGMVFAQKPAKLKAAMADILENAEADLTPLMRNLIDTLWGEWKLVEQQIEELNEELERISASDAACTRIRQIPGIGPVVATAIVAAIGNGAAFRKGREFAAWLGIVPRQHLTGLARSCSASVSAATCTSARSSFMARELPCCGSSAIHHQALARRSRAPAECCCRRHGQQARTFYCLGSTFQRQRLQTLAAQRREKDACGLKR